MSHETITLNSPRSVLFAMNDMTVAHAFARILESREHVTATADSLAMACELTGCEVLVADLDAGIDAGDGAMNGLELLAHLRALGCDPYTILIADRPTNEDYRRAIHLKVDDILERPLHPDDLIAAVEAAPVDRIERRGREAPMAMHIVLAGEQGAAEAAARDLIGWCARCEVTPPARARIGSAVAEIVQNSVDHGAASIEVVASMDGRQFEVEVVDDGPGFDAVAVLTDTAIDATSGLGRAQALSEELAVHSDAGIGTRVHLRFGVTTMEFEDENRIDLSDLDFFAPATSKELLATLEDEPDAPVVLSPALAVVVGRLLVGPDPRRVLQSALWS